jgi:hypothetical protein
MSTKTFRAAVVTQVMAWAAANFPTLPIIHENGPVPDEDKIGQVWLDLEIRWYGAKDLGIGQTTSGRHSGAISANVYYREGAGTGEVDDIIDSLKSSLKLQRVGGGIVRFPQRTVPSPQLKGWYRSGLLFPFTLDE